MGIFRVRGTIDIAQFWPEGQSDADTTKVQVAVGGDAFAFAEDGRTFKVTHVLDDARVVGKTPGPLIKKDRVTIRLQGIDAPELHYRAGPLPRGDDIFEEERAKFKALNKERRQHWGESATIALKEKLAAIGRDQIECEVVSIVEQPHELADTYGRIVANIRVGRNFDIDVNTWLVEEAWVVPTFYSSMTNEEIEGFLTAMRKGAKKGRVAGAITGDTSQFDATLLYRRHGELQDDSGPVLMPKMFRRQVAYQMQKQAGIVQGSFKSFLARSPDPCFELQDFLDNSVHSATETKLDQFMQGTKFARAPHELVFKEQASSLLDPQGHRLDHF